MPPLVFLGQDSNRLQTEYKPDANLTLGWNGHSSDKPLWKALIDDNEGIMLHRKKPGLKLHTAREYYLEEA